MSQNKPDVDLISHFFQRVSSLEVPLTASGLQGITNLLPHFSHLGELVHRGLPTEAFEQIVFHADMVAFELKGAYEPLFLPHVLRICRLGLKMGMHLQRIKSLLPKGRPDIESMTNLLSMAKTIKGMEKAIILDQTTSIFVPAVLPCLEDPAQFFRKLIQCGKICLNGDLRLEQMLECIPLRIDPEMVLYPFPAECWGNMMRWDAQKECYKEVERKFAAQGIELSARLADVWEVILLLLTYDGKSFGGANYLRNLTFRAAWNKKRDIPLEVKLLNDGSLSVELRNKPFENMHKEHYGVVIFPLAVISKFH